jgi:hypothetical protein
LPRRAATTTSGRIFARIFSPERSGPYFFAFKVTDMNHIKRTNGLVRLWGLLLVTAVAVTACPQARAQYRYSAAPDSAHGLDRSRLFAGGNVGLAFGEMTYLNLSPLAGYRFSPLFAAGVQINAQYESVRYHDAYGALARKERYTVLGGGVFGRVYPISQLFIHVQPEYNFIRGRVRYYDGTPGAGYHRQVPSLLAGAGFEQPTGGSAAFEVMILYDVLQNPDSPYGNQPIIRAGVHFGF